MFGWVAITPPPFATGNGNAASWSLAPNIPDHPTPSHHPISAISGAPKMRRGELQR